MRLIWCDFWWTVLFCLVQFAGFLSHPVGLDWCFNAILLLNSACLYSWAPSSQNWPPRRDGKSHFCPNYLIKHLNGILKSYTSVAVSISVPPLQTSSSCQTICLSISIISTSKKNRYSDRCRKKTKPVPLKCSHYKVIGGLHSHCSVDVFSFLFVF